MMGELPVMIGALQVLGGAHGGGAQLLVVPHQKEVGGVQAHQKSCGAFGRASALVHNHCVNLHNQRVMGWY